MRRMKRNIVLGTGLLLACSTATFIYTHFVRAEHEYHDSFAKGSMAEWKPYGGSWQVAGNVIANNSNESGSKVITGREN